MAQSMLTRDDVESMLDELYNEWVPGDVDVNRLYIWSAERFGLTMETITHTALKDAVSVKIAELKRIFELVNGDKDLRELGEVRDKLARVGKVIVEARNALQAAAVLYYQVDDTCNESIPDKWNPDSYFQFFDEDEKATSFQRSLMFVLRLLSIDQFRRLDDQCYRQVFVPGTNEPTHAWEHVDSIKGYISKKVAKEENYAQWKHLTNPHDNTDKVVLNLCAQEHIEFPTLVMNRYLWSYRNGLYNVRTDTFYPFKTRLVHSVQDVCASLMQTLPIVPDEEDMSDFTPDTAAIVRSDGIRIWNVSSVTEWEKVDAVPASCHACIDDDGSLMNAIDHRAFANISQLAKPNHAIAKLHCVTSKPPRNADRVRGEFSIWGVRADGSIPQDGVIAFNLYNIEHYFLNHGGVTIENDRYTLDASRGVHLDNLDTTSCVRLSDGRLFVPRNIPLLYETIFEHNDQFYINYKGREVWDKMARDITTFRNGMHLAHLDDVSAEAVEQIGSFRIAVPPVDASAKNINGVLVWNSHRSGALTPDTIFKVDATQEFYSNNNNQPIWSEPDGTPYEAVAPNHKDVAVKYFDQDFRFEITPQTEATFDPTAIQLPQMEKIMDSQKLEPDTQLWLIIMLCRLFFPVGFDKWQVCLFIKGIAGSGKSTLAQIIRSFYPGARVSTLSANIEHKFGLSGIYKGLVCICAEVRDEFGLDQGDWQSTVSGEEVQIAVKGKTAFAHKWDTPMFWLGNELPNYRNNSGSVERRVFMIQFDYKVAITDPKLFEKFIKDIDRFQRKGVSLYHMKLRQHGELDIWADGVVGKQLHGWKQNVRAQTDALYSYLTSGCFDFLGQMSFMPQDDFVKLYMQYRADNGWPKIKWDTDHFKSVFQDLGIHLTTFAETRRYQGRDIQDKWLLGLDLKQETTNMQG